MAHYLSRLFTAALVSSLGVGGGAGLLVFIVLLIGKGNQHAIEYALVVGGTVGLVFSAIILGIMMPLDLMIRWSLVRGQDNQETTAILEYEQSRQLTLRGSEKKIHFACRQALLSIPGVKNVHDDVANSKISATTGTNWRCPGEIIEVLIQKCGPEEFVLNCMSRPAIDKVVFDYGKNFENVELWKKRTQEFMRAGSAFGQYS
jgi:hypothetical protein